MRLAFQLHAMPMLPLNANDPVLYRELPAIRKIIQDETWLEGERRGCPVSPQDVVVRERVCSVVLRVGQELRERAMQSMPSDSMVPGITTSALGLEK